MSAAHRYAAVQNNTASKERLMVRLFEAALRDMRASIRHLEAKDMAKAMPLLDKSSQIVSYLHGTLNAEAAPKVVADLKEIYTFTIARLSRAIVTGKVSDVREAERAFAPVVDGFSQAVAKMTGAPATAAKP